MARRSGQPWSEDEVGYLKTWAGKKTVSEIARTLDRTIGAVTVAANQIKVSLRVTGANDNKTAG